MPTPTARVLALLELLQSGGVRSAVELAERLDVDERTVRRYVQHLIDLEVPVESVRGRYGGYRLGRGFRVPPLMFTDDEAVAVMLSLLTGRAAGAGAADTAADAAIAKVRRVLPERLSHRLDVVLDTLTVADRPGTPAADVSTTGAPRAATPGAAVLLPLAEAVQQHRPVAIRYLSADGPGAPRILHPHVLVVHAGRWYVRGVDAGLDEQRTFRLDRIVDARLLQGTFRVPEEVVDADGFLAGLAATPYRHLVIVRIRASAEHVRTRLPPSVAIVEPCTAGAGEADAVPWSRVRLRVERLEWVPAVLASLDRPFVIEQPQQLRRLVVELAERLRASAGRDVPGVLEQERRQRTDADPGSSPAGRGRDRPDDHAG